MNKRLKKKIHGEKLKKSMKSKKELEELEDEYISQEDVIVEEECQDELECQEGYEPNEEDYLLEAEEEYNDELEYQEDCELNEDGCSSEYEMSTEKEYREKPKNYEDYELDEEYMIIEKKEIKEDKKHTILENEEDLEYYYGNNGRIAIEQEMEKYYKNSYNKESINEEIGKIETYRERNEEITEKNEIDKLEEELTDIEVEKDDRTDFGEHIFQHQEEIAQNGMSVGIPLRHTYYEETIYFKCVDMPYRFKDRKLSQISLEDDLRILGVINEGRFDFNKPDTRMSLGDILVLVSNRKFESETYLEDGDEIVLTDENAKETKMCLRYEKVVSNFGLNRSGVRNGDESSLFGGMIRGKIYEWLDSINKIYNGFRKFNVQNDDKKSILIGVIQDGIYEHIDLVSEVYKGDILVIVERVD